MSEFSWLGIVRRGKVWETIPLEQAVRSDAHRWTILALFVFATLWLVVVVYQVDALPVPEYSLPPWDVHDKVEIWSTRSTLVDHEDLPWILVTSPLASGHKMWGEKCVSVLHSPPPTRPLPPIDLMTFETILISSQTDNALEPGSLGCITICYHYYYY